MQTTNSKKIRSEYTQRMLSEAEEARKSALKQIDTANLLISTYRTWQNAQNGRVEY